MAVAGRGHERTETPCQDVAVTETDGEVTVAVVADGAGSASRSDIGAALAAEVTLDLLLDEFEDLYNTGEREAARKIIDAVRGRLARASTNLGVNVRELGSTLLFAAVARGRYLVGHLGDGLIAWRRRGLVEPLSIQERGEFANETVFVTSRGAPEKLRIRKGAAYCVTAITLMSDGAAESLFVRQQRRVAPAVEKMWSWLESHPQEEAVDLLERSLAGPIRNRTSDDCSLAMMCLPSWSIRAF